MPDGVGLTDHLSLGQYIADLPLGIEKLLILSKMLVLFEQQYISCSRQNI